VRNVGVADVRVLLPVRPAPCVGPARVALHHPEHKTQDGQREHDAQRRPPTPAGCRTPTHRPAEHLAAGHDRRVVPGRGHDRGGHRSIVSHADVRSGSGRGGAPRARRGHLAYSPVRRTPRVVGCGLGCLLAVVGTGHGLRGRGLRGGLGFEVAPGVVVGVGVASASSAAACNSSARCRRPGTSHGAALRGATGAEVVSYGLVRRPPRAAVRGDHRELLYLLPAQRTLHERGEGGRRVHRTEERGQPGGPVQGLGAVAL